jgi:DNA topoisomerase I
MLKGLSLLKGLKKAHLHYTSDQRPGLMRQKIGKGFRYYDSTGKKVSDQKTLDRIEKLVIPPAWENVWICTSPTGHLQATGYDERGRKQYIYHPDWVKICQENKFSKINTFGKLLPKIRNRVKKDMETPGLSRKKVIATIVWLLEHTFIRIGNDEYAKENDSFGLTTLRNKHVQIKNGKVNLEFVGKSGVNHSVEINHPKIVKIIKSCIELPGYELFQYLDEEGEKHTIDSQDVNEYLKDVTGEDITAKDFRTWGATCLAADALVKIGECKDEKTFNKNLKIVVKTVSSHLRNTPAVCRSYYIHPAIISCYQNNLLSGSSEEEVLKLIKRYS